MIEIGKFNELNFIKKTTSGLILGDGEKEVLLPAAQAPGNPEPGDTFHVFVYLHSDGRMLATTRKPLATAGEFAFLEVIDQNEHGSFLDLGIEKDAFVPEREQKRPMRLGKKYVVYIYADERTGHLTASSKVGNYTDNSDFDLEVGQEVNLLISDQSELGYSAIINQKFAGLLYRNELYEELNPGDQRKGYIKKIREGNLVDLSLQPIGFRHILDSRDSLLNYLEENNGYLSLGDKSSPEEIYRRLKISKKAFKKTIGGLYKERRIEIFDFEIKLVKK